jgi:Divergent InlB B-repeat domain
LAVLRLLLAVTTAISLVTPIGLSAPGPVVADCATVCYTLSFQFQSLDGHNARGSGAVTSTDGLINCTVVQGVVRPGSTCSHRFTLVTTSFPYDITLTWLAAAGSSLCLTPFKFAGHVACHPRATAEAIRLDPERRDDGFTFVTDFYLVSPTLAVTASGSGRGSVLSSPAGIDCGATCKASFAVGTTVELAAAAAAGSMFTGWTRDCAGQPAICTLKMDLDRAATPVFAAAGSAGIRAPTASTDVARIPSATTTGSSGDLTPIVLAIILGFGSLSLAVVFTASRRRG